MVSLEERFRTAVLFEGGLYLRPAGLPEVDNFNFLPRVRVPVLMLNGRYDYTFPVDSSQKPFFRWLGTPEKDKRHVVYDAAHDVMVNRTAGREGSALLAGPVPRTRCPLNLGRGEGGGQARRHREAGPARSPAHLRAVVPPRWRRTRPDSIPAGTCVDSDDRTIPGLQAEAPVRGQRHHGA